MPVAHSSSCGQGGFRHSFPFMCVSRLRDELDRLEQQQRARMDEEEEQLAAAVEAEKKNQGHQAVLPSGTRGMGLALVNIRNRCVGW